jgi:hypothetical protein
MSLPTLRAPSAYLARWRAGGRPRLAGLALRSPLFFALAALGLLFLLWLRFYQPPNTVDDAYITFRYARNIATGVGFVYNAGERVLGTTTPAFALLLAAASRLSGIYDYPWLALVVNALINALTFCVLIRLTARLSGSAWVGLGAALLFAIEGRGLDFSTGGMEAGFNQLAILSTFLLLFENRTRWAAVALGAALLIRPDGLNLAAAFFGVLGVEWLKARRAWSEERPPEGGRRAKSVERGAGGEEESARSEERRAAGAPPHPHTPTLPYIELGIFALVVVPWVIFATVYFGNFIPQSILAKSELYRTPDLMAFRAFLVQARALWPFSLPPLQPDQTVGREVLQAIFPLTLAGVGLWAAQRRQPRAWAIGVYMALFIAFYSVGNPLWLGWYEIPLFPLYHVLFLTGVVWLAERGAWSVERPPEGGRRAWSDPLKGAGERRETRTLTRSQAHAPTRTRAHTPTLARAAALTAAVFVLALPHLSRLNLLPWETPQRAPFVLNAAFNKQRETDYRLLAHMLRPAAAQDRLVAIPEIGAFGYVYAGPLFDTAGLITPRTNDYYPIPAEVPFEIYAVPRRLIFDVRPDLFISFDSMLVGDLRPDDAEFLTLYPPAIGMVSHAAFGIQRLMVYRRADLPLEAVLPPEAAPREVVYGGGRVSLRGYDLRAWADPETEFLEVTLFWQGGAAPGGADLLARVNLVSAAGEVVYQVLDYLGEGLFPAAEWAPGQWLVDRYQLKRPRPDAGPYTVAITLFSSDSDFALGAEGEGVVEDTIVLEAPEGEE